MTSDVMKQVWDIEREDKEKDGQWALLVAEQTRRSHVLMWKCWGVRRVRHASGSM